MESRFEAKRARERRTSPDTSGFVSGSLGTLAFQDLGFGEVSGCGT